MYNQEIYRFLRKLFLLSLPIDMLLLCYLVIDPFKTTWHYDRYFNDHEAHISLNMDFVSTENFANRNPKHNYNAFIFGNSRSQYWQTAYWQKYIGKEKRCYHYYGNGETLFSMYNNIRHITKNGNRIDDTLLIVDEELLRQTTGKHGHLFITPPRITGYRNIIKFHATNFIAFLHPVFIFANVDYFLFKTVRPYMKDRYFFEQPVVYHPENNEVVDELYDQAIADGTYYTPQRMLRFKGVQHPDSISPVALSSEGLRMLTEIAQIFHRQHTRYKVVISPLYNQIKINPADVLSLQHIFGKEHVYDFSGRNAINADYHNYYEESHYRPVIARQLMDSLY